MAEDYSYNNYFYPDYFEEDEKHEGEENFIFVREITADEEDMIFKVGMLYSEVFAEPPWFDNIDPIFMAQAFKWQLENGVRMWVAFEGDDPIGMASGIIYTPEDFAIEVTSETGDVEGNVPIVLETLENEFGEIESVGYQMDLCVDKEYRGEGIASFLRQCREDYFNNSGCDIVSCRTKWTSNIPGWYTRHGYKIIFELPNEIIYLAKSLVEEDEEYDEDEN